jgi:CYTH domain
MMVSQLQTVDHQVTYLADPAVHAVVLQGLVHHRVVHRVLRTTYLDTPERDLFQRGITLRDRCVVKKSGTLGTAKTEAKVPTEHGLSRSTGSAAHAAVAQAVGVDLVNAVRLRPVATQTKKRTLLLVSGRAFAPDFVVALDVADAAIGSHRSQRFEIEAQIFTALPWTSRVTKQRIERFHAFCRQLETDFGLFRAAESGYQAIVKTAEAEATTDGELARADRRSEVHLFDGLTEGARLKTEALFSSSSQIVVDASHVTMVEHEGLSVVPVAEVFSNPNATFLGFGKPNVFLSLPRAATPDVTAGWDRFAAFMFWRKAAHIADTKGRVQGGVFVELCDLPPEALVRLRTAMGAFEGRKTITCANATGRVMTQAGFTCDGRTLAYKVRPMTLAKAIWDGGLEFDGTAVTLRMIRTHSGTVSDHFVGVLRKESTSLFRAVEKIVRSKSTKSVAKAPVIQARPLAAAAVPSHAQTSRLELRVGRFTKVAVLLHQQVGEHPIFEARLDSAHVDINGTDFPELRSALKAYPGKLDATSKLKRYVLFSRPVVKAVRYQLAAKMDSLGRLPGPVLVEMFQTGSTGNPFLYNVVITGTSARMTRLENRTDKDVGKANWVLAKHVLLSGYDPDVRYAGEIWVEDTKTGRVLHLNDNSGTYKPSRNKAEAAARFLQQLTGVPVLFHAVGDSTESPHGTVGDSPTA